MDTERQEQVTARQVITDGYALYQGDCLDVLPQFPDNSVGLFIYSPPFAAKDGQLYIYSSDDRDLSNAKSYGEFFEHYDYIIEQTHRLLMPGRMSCFHCMDTPNGNTGRGDSIIDFPGDIIEAHIKCRKSGCDAPEWSRRKGFCGHGWFIYTERRHIWQEPLFVRLSKMQKKLQHAMIVDDSTRTGVAGAGYVLTFRREGENPEPVTHERGLLRYAGTEKMPARLLKFKGWKGNQIENEYSHWIWRQYASCNWYDIDRENVLPYKPAKDVHDEKHVHPLQLQVIERLIELYSNHGDVVVDQNGGVGSVAYEARKRGRYGVSIDLKDTYHRQAVRNLEMCVPEQGDDHQVSLFEMIDRGLEECQPAPEETP